MRIELEAHGSTPLGQYEACCPPPVGTRVEWGGERYTVGRMCLVLEDGEPYARVQLYTGLQVLRAQRTGVV